MGPDTRMSVIDSAIYMSKIVHQRSRPKSHRMRYGVFFLLLDLDELDRLHRKLRWFSVNSFNLISFYDRDHGPGENQPLKPWVEQHLQTAGINLDGGRIRVLCLPRILGYVFNPISIYYCYHRSGALRAILYEVSNTFGERHSYLAPIDSDSESLLKHSCKKRFYVSPFMKVDGDYHFRVRQPNEKLFVHIHQTDDDGPILDAWVRGNRRTISDGALLNCLARNPLLMIKVIGGIHWEALKIWLKGIGVQKRPAPPPQAVTIISDHTAPDKFDDSTGDNWK
jgi:DUF1365 family protein